MALESKGWKVHEAETGQIGLQEAAFVRPDVVLLDLGLPDMDGVQVLQRLREWSDVPVLILSVRDQEEVKVGAFEAGADDYVTKPFGTAELLARLHAIQRRKKNQDAPECVVGPLRMDFVHQEVTLNGEAVKLTPTEYALLKLLARNVGKIVTQKQILRDVWGGQVADASHSLRVHVNHLRHKMEGSGVEIRNEPAIGYRLVE
jgi:two-component system KDP operon response regulator KdpE